MKKMIVFIGSILMAVSVVSAATVTNTVQNNVPWGDRFRERCIEVLDAVAAQLNTDTTAIATALATNVNKGAVAQIDANATTTATTKTPAHIGQLLIGGVTSQYDSVWYAKGTTSNDWKRLIVPVSTVTSNQAFINGAGTTSTLHIVDGYVSTITP